MKPSRFSPALRPKRSLGQNFLTDPNTARWIARQLRVSPDDHVVEIGPGKGILTQALLETGARVTAIEKDNALCEHLKERFCDQPRLEIIESDAVTFPWETITGTESPTVLIGNLPYNVSTQILWSLMDKTVLFRQWLFLFQKEVAERICAEVGTPPYGALSVFVQSVTRPSVVRIFPPKFFYPSPKVDSALVFFEMLPLTPPTPMQDQHFIRVVKAAFSHRRKMLRNNLKPLVGHDINKLESLFSIIGLKGTLRAQDLTVEDYFNLSERLKIEGQRKS